MLRMVFSAVLLTVPATAVAQGKGTSVLVDDRSRKALACVDVALVDSAGNVSERTQTSRTGEFQFMTAVRKGSSLRVSGQGLMPSTVSLDGFETDPAGNRRYPLFLEPLGSEGALEPSPAGDAPAGPIWAAPRLPDELRVPGMTGAVLIGLMIDAHGKADSTTIIELQVTHRALLASTITALVRGSYRPARRSGRDACTFVVQSFTFNGERR